MRRITQLVCISFLLIFLTSCATTPENMNISDIEKYDTFSESLSVDVIGGKQGRLESADYKNALVGALLDSGLVDQLEGSTMQLNVQILSVVEPMMGLDFTVKLRSVWILKSPDCSDNLRKQISSEFTQKLSDSIVAAQRLNRATEGAVRQNIKDGLKFISTEGSTWKSKQCK